MSHAVDISPQQIVNEYFEVVKRRMAAPSKSLRMSDEEDVAIEALEKFLRLAHHGAFGYIASREHLSGLIFLIARRRLREMLAYETAVKRGGNAKTVFLDQQSGFEVTTENCFRGKRSMGAKAVLERIYAELDVGLQEILRLWMQGKDSALISSEMGVSRRTVQYKLAEIRNRLPNSLHDVAW